MENWEKIYFNPKLKKIQIQRSRINQLIRAFFKKRGFLEVETATLVKCAGQEPYITPMNVSFEDERNRKYKGYLITSPEYSLKKLLVAGFEKIFEITKVFRSNESFGGIHNPEFTMIEWYRARSNYKEIMKDTEELVCFLNQKINNSNYLIYQNKKINLTLPWPRLTVKKAFLKYTDIDLDKCQNLKNFKKEIKRNKNLKDLVNDNDDWNDIFCKIFIDKIEPSLPKDRPIILYDYPLPQAALAKRKNKNSFYAERFEVFIAGIELANAFSELTDPKEQYNRFKKEQNLRKKLKKEIIPIDKDFIRALELKMPPSGGIALGIDRLQMLLLNIKDINDLLLFPAKQIFNKS
ncbi:MAG TPA: EF-P lysine aminoacylase EpmA [Candidatus Pacearchaeota archaeon]|nr:EF-P lysine aminoacylase EpmA [Candidatus Pacearchaeota archaeon]HOK94281.1 EF-P lysine aminoacylase EpmA [Candidatus Pacearchaeota archaeon]HPO75442.1 EF-P lysine aminoacylase EpmA [Candidatus Pacearchaeota archaeon]